MSTQPPNAQSATRTTNVNMAVAQPKAKAPKAAPATKGKMQMHRRSRTGSFDFNSYQFAILSFIFLVVGHYILTLAIKVATHVD